jgi:histidyl-tRNA synthetase
MDLRAPKGVFDIFPNAKEKWQDSANWQFIESLLRTHAHQYNFKEIRTPVFEHLELFLKGVGEGSDIVTKEMYNFLDKAGRSLALRPEGTAAVIRAYLENKIYADEKSSKLFYIEPMFRYERQQSGRYRQHHQFGAEAIGSSSPYQDVEIIEMAYNLYKKLGIGHLKVLINCVGSLESRKAYVEALRGFLEPKFNELSEDSKVRFQKNMLRILDSKDPNDQKLLEGCPNILEFLDDAKKEHFKLVLNTLTSIGIPYQIESKLVRGLDYYDNTVFEILTSHDGQSSLTIGGGGRYDGLIESYSGQKIPAVGFGTGIERIIQTLLAQNKLPNTNPGIDAYIIPMSTSEQSVAFSLTNKLRALGFDIDLELSSRKLKAALPYASQIGSRFAIIIGENEVKSGLFVLKNLQTRDEQSLDQTQIIKHLQDNKTNP